MDIRQNKDRWESGGKKDCNININSSRVCELGTNSCTVSHSKGTQPYNQLDHVHCWESKKPPCGLKGKHIRCCLCELRNPKAESEGEKQYKLIHTCKPDLNGYAICSCTTYKVIEPSDGLFARFEEEYWWSDTDPNSTSGLRDMQNLKGFLLKEVETAYQEGFDAGGKTVGGTGRTMYEAGQTETTTRIIALVESMKSKTQQSDYESTATNLQKYGADIVLGELAVAIKSDLK